MIDPVFWLVLSFLLVSMSLTAVLMVLVPAVRELSRAARSVEKLCDTLERELPPTLESIRLTSAEINSLTDDVNEGVQSASRVVQQVDQSVNQVRGQAKRAQVSTRSLMAGLNAALGTLIQPAASRDRRTLPRQQPLRQPSGSPPPRSTQRDHSANVKSPQLPQGRVATEGARSPAVPTQNGLPELPPGQRPAANLPSATPRAVPEVTDPADAPSSNS